MFTLLIETKIFEFVVEARVILNKIYIHYVHTFSVRSMHRDYVLITIAPLGDLKFILHIPCENICAYACFVAIKSVTKNQNL